MERDTAAVGFRATTVPPSVLARRRNARKARDAAVAARAKHKADAVAANAYSRLHVIPPWIRKQIREDHASVERMRAGTPNASDLAPPDRSFSGRIALRAAHRATVFAYERQRAAARAAARAEGQRDGPAQRAAEQPPAPPADQCVGRLYAHARARSARLSHPPCPYPPLPARAPPLPLQARA